MEGGGGNPSPPPWTERRQKSLDWIGLILASFEELFIGIVKMS